MGRESMCLIENVQASPTQASASLYFIYIKFLQCLMYHVCLSVCHVFFTKTTNLYISTKKKDNDMKPSGYDPVLQVSRQEPLTSSKYPLLIPPFLSHFQLGYQHEMFRVSSLG